MKKIVFVCMGNTCRSPMAEALLKNKLNKIHGENYKKLYNIESKGIIVNNTSMPAGEAIKVMKEIYEIDISSHKPTQITEEKIKTSDLILCMEEVHAEFIKRILNKEQAQKVHVLRKYVGLADDVFDPYGGNKEIYTKCVQMIDEALELLIKKEGI